MQSIGQIIRQRREELGLTLAALAQRTDSTKGYLSMIENHRVANPPSAQMIDALEQALEIKDGSLRAAAQWALTPPAVRAEIEQLTLDARKGRDLAAWLKENTSRRKGGGKNLDKLFKSGALRRQIDRTLGQGEKKADAAGGRGKAAGPSPIPSLASLRRIPVINKVAAGQPTAFTDLGYPARVADQYIECPSVDDPDAFAATVTGQSMMPEYRVGDIVVFSPQARIDDGCDCFIRLEPDHECLFKRVFINDQTGELRLQPLNPQFAPRLVEREQVAGLYRAVWRMSKL